MTIDRRQMLKTAAIGGPVSLATLAQAASAAPADTIGAPPILRPNSIPVSELPSHFDVDRSVHNLEAGYWSMMPRIVAETYARHMLEVNRSNSLYARNVLPGDNNWTAGARAAQAAIARQVGVQPAEIAILRSGSDALQMLITNYKRLKPGDAAIHCDLDYDSAIAAMRWLGTRRGIDVVRFAMPEPATTANILGAYEDVLRRTPHAKLLLVTHISNRTGLVTPVREIVAMARARGVDTIVDAAHAVALLDFQLEELGCDFAAWSVHKWTAAPLGTGAMFIRSSRLADIDAALGSDLPADDINACVPPGTLNFGAVLTIPTAVDFHFAVGAAAKERHLRGLRDRWVTAIRDLPNVEITVPDDPARYCAITSFRLKNMDSDAKAQQVQRVLLEKHKILTVWRPHIAKGPAIRVTPGLYSIEADLDALAMALRAEHAMFA